MTETLEGSCTCGAVRYTVKPGFRFKLYACHCTECQTRSGSAFGLQLPVFPPDIEVTGEMTYGEYSSPSGAGIKTYGCPKCMTRLYTINDTNPLAVIRAGTLDNSSKLVPAAHFWVQSKQPWIVIPDGAISLETQPRSPEDWVQLLGPGT
jgi:hypothetical protein